MNDFSEAQVDAYRKYEEVRQSGVTNMFDSQTVCSLSGLSMEDYVFVMNNYRNLNSFVRDLDAGRENKLKVVATLTSHGLVEGRVYTVKYEYDTVYEIETDNGSVCRPKGFFDVLDTKDSSNE